MPWCPRCGTGISQMEMNEGYQDREDPGLTVRFPLVDRPGECAAGLDDDALDARRERRRGRRAGARLRPGPPGRATSFWVGKGTAQAGGRGRVRGRSRRSAGASWSAGATPARSTSCRPCARRSRRGPATTRTRPYEHRVVPWAEVGEDEGTGIVHIAPGAGAEDFQLGKSLGLPVIAPLDEDGRYFAGLRLAERASRRPRSPRRSSTTSSGAGSSTTSSRTPTATRTAGAAARRCSSALVDEWFISMGQVYDKPRDQLTQGRGRREPALPDHGGRRPDPVDPGVRLRARARLAAEHARLDDQQEALLGPGAADLRLRGVRHVRRHRRPRGAARSARSRAGRSSRATRRTGPYVDAVKIALPRAAASRSTRIPDVGNPWLDAGIVPFSTLHYREDPELLGEVVPGRLHHRELPGPVPQLVLLDARDEHGAAPRGAVQDDLRLRHAVRRGRPADAQELGQRDRVRRGRRAHGRRRHALDVRLGAARGQHPLRLARRRRGAPRAARPVERLRVLRHLRPARRLGARAGDRRGDRGRRARGRRSTAGSCRAPAGLAEEVGRELADYDALGRDPR